MEACKILKEILNQKLVLLSPVFQKIKKIWNHPGATVVYYYSRNGELLPYPTPE